MGQAGIRDEAEGGRGGGGGGIFKRTNLVRNVSSERKEHGRN